MWRQCSCVASVAICIASLTLEAAQAPAIFELVSIRPTPTDGTTSDLLPKAPVTVLPDGRLEAHAVTLVDLARIAYGFETVDPGLAVITSGAGAWTERQRFDVTAATNRPWPSATNGNRVPSEVRESLRSLLEDRFSLRARVEQRRVEGYALRLAKAGTLGPLLRPSAHTCEGVSEQPPESQQRRCVDVIGRDRVEMHGVTMQDFVQRVLRSRIDGPVVDETRLLGRYDLVLTTGLPPAEPTTLTVLLRTNIALFEAMKAQLGLELKSAKVPMPTLIIQDAKRPVED